MSMWLEPVSTALQIAAAVLVAGAPFFSWLFKDSETALAERVSRKARVILLLALLIFVVAQVGHLLVQLSVIADSSDTLLVLFSANWQLYLLDTRPGNIWLFRTALSLVILATIATWIFHARTAPVEKPGLWLPVTVAGALLVAAGAWSGHYAGDSDAWEYPLLHAVHLVAVALWVGSLPLWWMTVRSASANGQLTGTIENGLRRFSYAAMLLVVIAVGTGIPLAEQFIDSQGDLLGTRWGLLLVIKVMIVALVLVAANRVRQRLNAGLLSQQWALRAVGVEIGLVLVVIILASLLAQATPAAHDQPFWRFPFRISYDAIASYDSLVRLMWSGMAVAVAALVFAALTYRRSAHTAVILASICGSVVAISVTAWAASVPAYPDTFRRSDVPYVAESIASGIRLFGENCMPCHGSGGRGDGPISSLTRLPPADLAAPHTALHTAGDMFAWITNGMPSGAMPGFSKTLSEQDRWDLVNFLRAFSQGFQARLFDIQVVPNQPWLGAPDFYLSGMDGNLSQLKTIRGRPALLLIQKSCGTTLTNRLMTLTQWRRSKEISISIVVACAGQKFTLDDPREIWLAQSVDQVIETYSLLSRTLDNKGEKGMLGVALDRTEFLVDRYGYIRARWIPAEDSTGWAAPAALSTELDVLSRESRIPPPPDSHIH